MRIAALTRVNSQFDRVDAQRDAAERPSEVDDGLGQRIADAGRDAEDEPIQRAREAGSQRHQGSQRLEQLGDERGAGGEQDHPAGTEALSESVRGGGERHPDHSTGDDGAEQHGHRRVDEHVSDAQVGDVQRRDQESRHPDRRDDQAGDGQDGDHAHAAQQRPPERVGALLVEVGKQR